ncbi:MAG: thiamine pyrophosphate-binding protein [Nitrospirae bacterium]|nr:thiamine pyrophosphate-binding protein [Nitrospirota bacterium]
MRLAPYLFQRLFDLGAAHAFGIPGDVILPLYEALEESPIRPILTTHEPSAGFAADAYARLKGIGVAVGTYGAGALNMVNPAAQAYAEKSPVVVISGAPDIADRNPDLLIHHKVRTFDTQLRIYEQATVASAALEDPATAYREINRVIETVRHEKRPGYLEIPRDMVWAEIAETAARPHFAPRRDAGALVEAMQDITARVNRSRNPVILAGVEIMRLGLRDQLIRLAECYNLPVATSFMGKAVFPEHHPNFIGTYMGAAGHPYSRLVVEGSDCLLMLGAWLTDTETGLFTSAIPRGTLIQVLANEVTVSRHRYDQVGLVEVMDALLERAEIKPREFRNEYVPERTEPQDRSLISAVFLELSRLDDRRYVFTVDVGDCLFGSVELNAENILNPGYYASMGFGVPAALGAGLAAPDRRPVALVGDGGFQMTGMELGTLVRYGVDAVVVVLNNGGYRSLEALGAARKICDIYPWDYVAVARAIRVTGVRVRTAEEFGFALQKACDRQGVSLIEVVLDPGDMSPTLRRLSRRTPS